MKKMILWLLVCLLAFSTPVVFTANEDTVKVDTQSKKKYTITYELNGGKNNSKNPSTYTKKTKTVTLQNPTRKGYTFKGWYSDAKYKNKVTQIEKGSTGNKKLYAKWSAKKYNIKFDGNGSTSGKMDTMKNVSYNKKVALTKNKFKKKGYTFVGWNTKKNGKGKSYSNAQKVSKLSTSGGKTVTLYAQWKVKKYKITYEMYDGDNNSKNPKTYTINDKVTLKNPTKKCCDFKGWYTDANLTKKFTGIPKGSTGDVKVYARFVNSREKLEAYLVKAGYGNVVQLDKVTYAVLTPGPTYNGEPAGQCLLDYLKAKGLDSISWSGGWIDYDKERYYVKATNCYSIK